MEAEMVLVKRPLVTLDQVSVWSSCQVTWKGGKEEYVRYLASDGYAWLVGYDGKLRKQRPATQYTVLRILGPKPSGNKPEDARSPELPEPVKLSELPPFVWAMVKLPGLVAVLRCHNGSNAVYSIDVNGVPDLQAEMVPDDYTVVPGSKRWQLRIKVSEGEESDDGKH